MCRKKYFLFPIKNNNLAFTFKPKLKDCEALSAKETFLRPTLPKNLKWHNYTCNSTKRKTT